MADRPADGLVAFARTRWELLRHGSTLDRFLAGVPDSAVQVVPLGM